MIFSDHIVCIFIMNRGYFIYGHRILQVAFERGILFWQERSQIHWNCIFLPDLNGMYQSWYHIAAFKHAGFLGAPESRVDHCSWVPWESKSQDDISDCSGSACLIDPGERGYKKSKEGSICPEIDGAGDSGGPAYWMSNLSWSYSS